jgi:phosphoglycerate dehydrogenase-like enzyme
MKREQKGDSDRSDRAGDMLAAVRAEAVVEESNVVTCVVPAFPETRSVLAAS